jgi:hypothetical protein
LRPFLGLELVESMKRNVSPIESVSSHGESQMAVQQEFRITGGGSTGHE